MLNAAVLPWNQAQWRRLAGRWDNLAHALLLAGPAGLGKQQFALSLAQALLCGQPREGGEACGACKSCHLFVAGGHPDFHLLAPTEPGKSLLIDQVRALGEFMALRPHTAARKVAVITPADALNLAAANSLLKVLEEPPLGSYLLLVTAQPGLLPATIRSRCTRLRFTPPNDQAGLDWLKEQAMSPDQAGIALMLADRAPLRALGLAQGDFFAHRERLLKDIEGLSSAKADPLARAADWKKLGGEACLDWFQRLLIDLVRLRANASSAALFNPDLRARLQALGQGLHLKQLFQLLDVVSANKKAIGGPLDELLLLEEALIGWVRLVRRT